MKTASKLKQLETEGFCLFPGILDVGMVSRLRSATDELFENYGKEQKQRAGGQGSIVQMPYMPTVFSDLIAWPKALRTFGSISFKQPRFWSGYVISKEPSSPPSYWHQDWPFWDNPVSAEPLPHQVFFMYYLTDTRPENGCLRAIPGSHRRRFPQHDFGGHDTDVRQQDPATSPAYANSPDQVDLPVNAGDLLIGDARLLHAPHGNCTDERRTVITMWYLSRYDELPEEMRAAFQSRLLIETPDDLPAKHRSQLQPLLPDYFGGATPTPWNRVPGKHLMA